MSGTLNSIIRAVTEVDCFERGPEFKRTDRSAFDFETKARGDALGHSFKGFGNSHGRIRRKKTALVRRSHKEVDSIMVEIIFQATFR